jgi:hypothetical protein
MILQLISCCDCDLLISQKHLVTIGVFLLSLDTYLLVISVCHMLNNKYLPFATFNFSASTLLLSSVQGLVD